MSVGLSIRTRAVLALVLLVGFYLLALGIAGGLLYIPYAEWIYVHRVDVRLLLFCVIGAFLILKAIVPRLDRFTIHGPRLSPDEHPALFAVVDDVARATEQVAPAEVYVVADVNAFVTERGGIMGIGSRRVMGIGLPLLELLSVEELRAVVAHEFGHYVSGDTRLGPWIYKTRAAIGRTLHEVAGHSRWLAKPFEWYGVAFLRITHAVSRAQEFVADATAARVTGREAARRALVRIAGGASAFDVYWRSEVGPTVDRGFRPPLAAGFRQFLAAPSVVPEVAALVDRRLADTETDPYDTHPNLRDRLAALDRLSAAAPVVAPRASDDAPATSLLTNVDAVEATLLSMLTRNVPLAPVTWEAVPTTVLPIVWREPVAKAAAGLSGITPEAVPTLAGDVTALAIRLRLAATAAHVQDKHRTHARDLIGAAISLTLLQRAATNPALRLDAPPGEPVRFFLGAAEIRPFSLCQQLADGTLDPAVWIAQCEQAGILGADLGRAAETQGPVTRSP